MVEALRMSGWVEDVGAIMTVAAINGEAEHARAPHQQIPGP